MTLRVPPRAAFAVRGPIARADLPGLCDRVCRLLAASGSGVVVCDVSGIEPDAVTVDALAQLQLAAGRRRCRVLLRNASAELVELVAFMGLADVLPECDERRTLVDSGPLDRLRSKRNRR
jgi:ABC-type transporter Mla MlaB component